MDERDDLQQYQDEPKQAPAAKKGSGLRTFGRILAKLGIFVVEVALLAVLGVYCIGQLVSHGPSEYAGGLLAGWFAETGVFKKGEPFRFVANLFYTEEQLAVYEHTVPPEVTPDPKVDIYTFTKPADPNTPETTPPEGPVADAWGLVDEDGDGIILEEVKGSGYQGFMLVVLDPSRVIMGCNPAAFEGWGYTVEGMVNRYNGVAGINAGGFEDAGGHGNGGTPNSMVVYKGVVHYASKGTGTGFAGFDSNHNLHVGNFSTNQIHDLDIQYGASFGPVLIQNGQVNTAGIKNSGVNPRTAIGQRSDGAVLMLVINGRQSTSLGATYQDLADVFMAYGAVNACNLDGGSSSLLWYQERYVNKSASLIGVRPVPTTFVVLAKEADTNG